MNEFISLNKGTLKFGFIFISVTLTILVSAIFIYSTLKGQVPEISLIITVLLGAGIGMPTLLLGIAGIRGIWDLNQRRKAFDKQPFSELMQHGFMEQLKKDSSKWSFSEPVLQGVIEGYQILAEVDTQYAPDVIRFQALTKLQVIEKERVKQLSRKFKDDDIELDFKGVTKKISIRDNRIDSITKLLTELTKFIKIVEKENFKPEEKRV